MFLASFHPNKSHPLNKIKLLLGLEVLASVDKREIGQTRTTE
jgi:hypothetical protein